MARTRRLREESRYKVDRSLKLVIITKYSATDGDFDEVGAIYNGSRDLLDTIADEIPVGVDRQVTYI